MAEEQGFEPWVGYKPTPVFKTGALNHSATPPNERDNSDLCCHCKLKFLNNVLIGDLVLYLRNILLISSQNDSFSLRLKSTFITKTCPLGKPDLAIKHSQ